MRCTYDASVGERVMVHGVSLRAAIAGLCAVFYLGLGLSMKEFEVGRSPPASEPKDGALDMLGGGEGVGGAQLTCEHGAGGSSGRCMSGHQDTALSTCSSCYLKEKLKTPADAVIQKDMRMRLSGVKAPPSPRGC
jgi:hypothetical protein